MIAAVPGWSRALTVGRTCQRPDTEGGLAASAMWTTGAAVHRGRRANPPSTDTRSTKPSRHRVEPIDTYFFALSAPRHRGHAATNASSAPRRAQGLHRSLPPVCFSSSGRFALDVTPPSNFDSTACGARPDVFASTDPSNRSRLHRTFELLARDHSLISSSSCAVATRTPCDVALKRVNGLALQQYVDLTSSASPARRASSYPGWAYRGA